MLRQFTSKLVKWTNLHDNIVKVVNVRNQSTDYSAKCEGLVVEPKNQVLWIKFDRPSKFNAITREMYIHLSDTFEKTNSDSSIKAIVLTGNGEYYSSGNDLTNFTLAMQDPGGPKAGLTKSKDILFRFVASLINLEKFLIAAVNGPAVGIPVTTLPLCDYILASDKATFQTPFTALGQCPEACSSYTLPQILGRSKSSELLLLNMMWDAQQSQRNGLVSQVVKHDEFHAYLDSLTNNIVKSCYPRSLLTSKSLIQSKELKEKLHQVNRQECETILDCWLGEECADAVQKFFKRSKK